MSGKSEVNDDVTGSPRRSLVITQKHIDDIIAGAARPTTPPLEDTDVDDDVNADTDCGIPFCPKHGIQNRAMRRKMSAPTEVTRRKSGSIVLERKGSAPAMPQLMLMGDNNDNTQRNVQTAQGAKSTESAKTDIVCIRDTQRKRMKRLSRIESDKQMQRNYDNVHKELKRKLSDPNPTKAVETAD